MFNNVGGPNIIYVDKKQPPFKIKHNKQNMDSPLKHQDRFTLMDYQFNQNSSKKKLSLPQEENQQKVMVWQRKNLLKSQYLLIQNSNKNNQPQKDKEKWVFGGDKNMKLDKVLFSELMYVYKKEN